MPAVAVASAAARSELQRAPLSMSAEDSQGLKALTIMGKYSLSVSATARLRGPDQLMKMSIVSRIVLVAFHYRTTHPFLKFSHPALAQTALSTNLHLVEANRHSRPAGARVVSRKCRLRRPRSAT